MKKHFATLLIILLLFTACSTKPQPNESSTSTPTSTPSTSTGSPTEETSPTTKPIDYKWNPAVYSKAFAEFLGEDTEEMYQGMVTAILNRKESFTCNEKYYEQLYMIVKTCFPCAEYLVDFGGFDGENVPLKYLVSKEEQQEILKKFGERVEDLICNSVYSEDSDTVAAISVYNYFCKGIIYDYEAEESDNSDVSPYRAIMEGKGICQSFAPAYAHLCVQLQIPAFSTGGLSSDNSQSHEWTQLKLDGVYYYADPTWQTDGGLEWFGFTSKYREEHDDYPAAMQNIGELNLYMADKKPVGDDRFEELRNCIYNVEITRKENILTINANDEGGKSVTITIE